MDTSTLTDLRRIARSLQRTAHRIATRPPPHAATDANRQRAQLITHRAAALAARIDAALKKVAQ